MTQDSFAERNSDTALRHTLCPCVLTENGFMTNEQECRWLMTEEAIEAIAMTHVEGIAGDLLAST